MQRDHRAAEEARHGDANRRKSLTGLMFCGGCGAKMTEAAARRPSITLPGSSKEETYPCGKVGIVAPWVEELVMNTVVERLSVHDFKLDDDQPDNSPRLAAINARLDAIDATIKDAAKRTATAGRAELRALMLVTEQLDEEQSQLIAERDALIASRPPSHITAMPTDFSRSGRAVRSRTTEARNHRRRAAAHHHRADRARQMAHREDAAARDFRLNA